MLIIIIGLFIGILVWTLAEYTESIIITLLGSTSIICCLLIGIFCPMKWKEPYLESETKLVQLSNSLASEGGGLLYVSITADNVYKYRHEVDSEYGTETSKEYVVETVSNSNNNVIEVEDPNCKEPVLRVYTKKGKMTIWTFGCATRTEYIFYVPEGTISREVKLE